MSRGDVDLVASSDDPAPLLQRFAEHPGVQPQLFNADGSLHKFLNVYVNDDDVRYLGGLDAPVADGDEVTLLPAVAGGAA